MYLYFQYEFYKPLSCNFNCVYAWVCMCVCMCACVEVKNCLTKRGPVREKDKIRCLIIGKVQQQGWDLYSRACFLPLSSKHSGGLGRFRSQSIGHNCAVFTWFLVSIWWSYHLPGAGAGAGAAQEDLTTETSHLEGPAAVLAFYTLICTAEMSKCPLEGPTISFSSPAVLSNNRC